MSEYTPLKTAYTFLLPALFVAIIPLLSWYERTAGTTPALSLLAFLLGIAVTLIYIPATLFLDPRNRPNDVRLPGKTKKILIIVIILTAAAAALSLFHLTQSTPETCTYAVVTSVWGMAIIAVPAIFILHSEKIRCRFHHQRP